MTIQAVVTDIEGTTTDMLRREPPAMHWQLSERQ